MVNNINNETKILEWFFNQPIEKQLTFLNTYGYKKSYTDITVDVVKTIYRNEVLIPKAQLADDEQ
jgi:hypothetical protein